MLNYRNQFNQQIRHRGQVTTLHFQAGIKPEAIGLLVILMEKKR